MRKIVKILLISILALVALSACANDEIKVPEGLQIVKVSESDGYQFFGPEGWIIANDGAVAASYVSTINNTSISLAKVEMPTCSVQEYFNNDKENFAYPITVIEEGETTFGNGESAYYYVYTFEYEKRAFACMQIFVKNAGDFYIFTYNSYGDPTKEDSEYQLYMSQVRPAIDAFVFTEKKATATEDNLPQADSDGFVMVSNPEICGFSLYIPAECQLTSSSMLVSAKFSDKANFNITKSSSSGVSILDYLKSRKTELSALFGEVSDLRLELESQPMLSEENKDLFDGFNVEPSANPDITFGNLDKSKLIVYEYSYSHNGVKYMVYQILGVDSFNGYVFTYTATEDEYEKYMGQIKSILEKVNFQ